MTAVVDLEACASDSTSPSNVCPGRRSPTARASPTTLGFDGLWGFDHFQPMYGDGPGECFEGNTTLAALSGITERVRLGLLVTGMTYRHPSVFAAEAITIDHASGGRLELSYGAAWFEQEHRELGIPFPALKDRVDAFEEAVQIVRGLLTTDGFTLRRPALLGARRDACCRVRCSSRTHRSGSARRASSA